VQFFSLFQRIRDLNSRFWLENCRGVAQWPGREAVGSARTRATRCADCAFIRQPLAQPGHPILPNCTERGSCGSLGLSRYTVGRCPDCRGQNGLSGVQGRCATPPRQPLAIAMAFPVKRRALRGPFSCPIYHAVHTLQLRKGLFFLSFSPNIIPLSRTFCLLVCS